MIRTDALKRHRDYNREDGEGACPKCIRCGYEHENGRVRVQYELTCQGDCEARVEEDRRRKRMHYRAAAAAAAAALSL